MSLGVAIGALTFTGSVIAFLKLSARMSGAPIILPFRHVINIALALALVFFIVGLVMSGSALDFWLITIIALVLGVLMIIPIGGADMPVVISMLNSYSGWAAAGIGFTLGNSALIITGALVGSSGAILSYIMCHAMNRSFISVILGGFGGETAAAGGGGGEQKPAKLGSADDAAFIMKNAQKVIIVPGYGMAVAQAQHALREMGDLLKKEGVEVKYAIHPVAGRMPGHMNVLLAEANVPYDEVFELEDINSEFAQADIAFVIGANDVTNPAAEDDKTSPIYGMPVLQVWKAGTVMFIKRSLASGYAGIDNPLFYRDNTMMLLGDAKFLAVEDEEFKNAQTAGGYAKEMSKEYQAKQAALTAEHIKKQDIVITTALIPGRPAPKLVSAEMVKSMKPGSVLVDLAVERGGNVEGAKAGRSRRCRWHQDRRLHQCRRPRRGSRPPSLYARNLFNFIETHGRQDEQGARGELGRRAGESHRADQRRRRHPPELPAESLRREAMEHIAQAVDPFVFRLSIFVLAVFVGYFVVWSVTPALHTPLMSVTNAISSVIVVGALLAVGVAMISSGSGWARGFGFVALIFACVNIFGGFLVTQRMLAMYKKKVK